MSNDILVKNQNSPALKVKRLMELQELVNKAKPEIDRLKAELLQTMQEQDVLSLKTGSYTLSRAKRVTPQVVNYETLKKSLENEGIEVITQEIFAPQMDVVFRQAIEEGREFEGLEAKQTEYVAIRLKK